MPFYHQLGKIPKKRHTQFRKDDGSLYREEVMGTRGFSGIQSILYHLWQPTSLKNANILEREQIETIQGRPLQPSHIKGGEFKSSGDPISARRWLFVNQDVKVGLSTPDKKMDYFYRNGLADEIYFVHEGSGVFRSQFGKMPFCKGDYIVIPVGITFCIEPDSPCKFLTVESRGRVESPRRYRNEYGQLLEHSPYCERDIRIPQELETHHEKGEFEIRVKMGSELTQLTLAHHPFDVVGWDGYLYPWIINIADFEPITGRIHQPPPVHQTFAADGYVLCSFVPRMYDYHPEAVPVPYNHSNVNSDEVLYYVDGSFMSRKGLEVGSFSLHPAGVPHGPHPGTVEASLGKDRTEELAVMIDTFHPLQITTEAEQMIDHKYLQSWLES